LTEAQIHYSWIGSLIKVASHYRFECVYLITSEMNTGYYNKRHTCAAVAYKRLVTVSIVWHTVGGAFRVVGTARCLRQTNRQHHCVHLYIEKQINTTQLHYHDEYMFK